jgi:hypothetical protein
LGTGCGAVAGGPGGMEEREMKGSVRGCPRRTQTGKGPLRMSCALGPAYPPCPASLFLQMLLHLFSDANYNLLGFNASFRFSLCPGGCRSHGQCRPPGVCACEPGWGGPDCGLQECSAYCGSHGTCASVSWCPVCPSVPDLLLLLAHHPSPSQCHPVLSPSRSHPYL